MEYIKTFFEYLEKIEGNLLVQIFTLLTAILVGLFGYFKLKAKQKSDALEAEKVRQFELTKIEQQRAHETKVIQETERERFILAIGELNNRWDKHYLMVNQDLSAIKEIMYRYINPEYGANIVSFCVCKNGGDHVVTTKQYTITVLLEVLQTAKKIKSEKENWQNVVVDTQLHSILKEAVLHNYVYIEDYERNLEDGDLKPLIDRKSGSSIAVFYIGRIEKEQLFLTFQFGELDRKKDSELKRIRNHCYDIKGILEKTHSFKKSNETYQRLINAQELKLIKSGVIDEHFINNYARYLNEADKWKV